MLVYLILLHFQNTLHKHIQTYTKNQKWKQQKLNSSAWQSDGFIYTLIWIVCLSGMIRPDMSMRGNIESDQKNSVGLLHEVRPRPSGICLVKQCGLCSRASAVFPDTTCMHAHIHGCSSNTGTWLFYKRTQNINVVTGTKPFFMFSLSCINENAATSCRIEVHN